MMMMMRRPGRLGRQLLPLGDVGMEHSRRMQPVKREREREREREKEQVVVVDI